MDSYDTMLDKAKKELKQPGMKNQVNIEGFPAKHFFKAGGNLKSLMKPWLLNYTPIGSWEFWVSPELLERCLSHSDAVVAAANNAKNGGDRKMAALEKAIKENFTKVYLPIIINKFLDCLPDLAEYLAAKADYGGLFEKDREEFESLKRHLQELGNSPIKDGIMEDENGIRFRDC